MKMIAFGVLYPASSSYFRSIYRWFDFFIVVFSIARVCSDKEIIQAGISLLPLRLIAIFRGLRVIISAIRLTLPLIFSVAIFFCLVLNMFACIGMQFWGGRLKRCQIETLVGPRDSTVKMRGYEWSFTNLEFQSVAVQPEYAYPTEEDCNGVFLKQCGLSPEIVSPEWTNPGFSFDTIFQAWYAIFEISLINGWSNIMYNCMDTTVITRGFGPVQNNNMFVALVLVMFVLCAAYIMVNAFIAVIVDNYARMAEILNFGGVLTVEQKQWIVLQRKLVRIKPKPVLEVSKNIILRFLFSFTMHIFFE